MQYAIMNGERSEPVVGGRGRCPTCDSEMIAKCGPRVLHHWAHKGKRNCDPWWENESDWHRKWKGYFPENCREIHHRANDGEIHRADIRTPTGIYIEVQHSSMLEGERNAREDFYGNLLWIVDGRGFIRNFDILHKLPNPKSPLASDLIWFKARRGKRGSSQGMFYRLSETQRHYPDEVITKSDSESLNRLVQVHSTMKILTEIDQSYCGHHQYDWIRPRRIWLDSTCPVFIDFGNQMLVKLDIYDSSGLPCIQYVSKRHFIQETMTKSCAGNVCDE